MIQPPCRKYELTNRYFHIHCPLLFLCDRTYGVHRRRCCCPLHIEGCDHRRTDQHPFGGSNPVLPEWSRANILSFARINVIFARIGGSTAPPLTPRPVRLWLRWNRTFYVSVSSFKSFFQFIIKSLFP